MSISIPNYEANQRLMWNIEKFGGLNKSVVASQIAYNESPDCLNAVVDRDGNIQGRTGYDQVFTTALESEPWATAVWATDQWEGHPNDTGIRLLGVYRRDNGEDERLLIHEGSIFKWDDTGNTKIYDLLADNPDNYMIQVENFMYFGDGTNYVKYDGTTFSTVESSAYIPTITLGRAPSGGGTSNEDLNLISAGFKDSFSADGTSTLYQLSFINLDVTAVSVEYNNSTLSEGVAFTVNRTNGTVDFSTGSAPLGAPAAGTNNVVITAYKTQTGFADRIKKCTKSILYGGSNDSRLMLTGNPDSPNVIYRSGLDVDSKPDPTYFPENSFSLIGDKNENIQNFGKHYDSLIIFKEASIYQMTYTIVDGAGSFPTKPLNDSRGAFAKNSLALVNNSLVALDRTGVRILNRSDTRDERNFELFSVKVNADLLNEPNLENAIAYDFDNKYFLTINNNVYVWDYDKSSYTDPIWFKWDNVPASDFYEYENYLYFGSNANGEMYKFKKEMDTLPYNDDRQPINMYWYSKQETFNAPAYYKIIEDTFPTLKPGATASANVYYITDITPEKLIQAISSYLFDYSMWHYDNFSYISSEFPKGTRCRINKRQITYLQIKLENLNNNETFSITNLSTLYEIQETLR